MQHVATMFLHIPRLAAQDKATEMEVEKETLAAEKAEVQDVKTTSTTRRKMM